MKNNPLGLPSTKVLGLALAAGIIAGAGAVYMKVQWSGNGDAQLVAANAECPISERVEKLRPLMKGNVAALIPASGGRNFSDLAFKGPDGQAMTLGDLSGKPLLVNLWATWCAPCRAEMPALDSLQEKTSAAGDFAVVAINIDNGDSDEKPRAFLDETGVKSLGFYRDGTLAAFNRLKKEGLALGLPATFIVDEKGCLLASMNGPAAWDSQDALNFVNALKSPS